VINTGEKIAEGAPAEIKADPKVSEAFLGSDADRRRGCCCRPSNHQETFMLSQHGEKHDVSHGYVAEQ
jgi:hypothetical protein